MFESNPSFQVQVTDTATIFPFSHQVDNPIVVPLSIIDATVSCFGRAACIFYHEPPSASSPSPLPLHYQTSLSRTLDSYPQWCGRLAYNVGSKSDRGHLSRYRRVTVTYNSPSDLGVQFITATSPKSLSTFLPTIDHRRTGSLKAWDVSNLPSNSLLPSTTLALANSSTPDSPNLVIQHTTFACGSVAISISITHSLADAHSLSQFARDWGTTSSALLKSPTEPLPKLTPIFNPKLLDDNAAGDIDAMSPDPEIQEIAHSLPCLRLDWYKQVPNQPWPAKIPSGWESQDLSNLTPSTPIPWSDWYVEAPVSERVLHFTPIEVQNIYNTAQASGTNKEKVSKLDTLLAHLAQRIEKARRTEQKYMTLTFGLRPRLKTPLPSSFLGSPIMLTAIPAPVTPTAIRQSLNTFTPENIAAHLHATAFEVSPQRLWQGMLGSKSILVTSWLHLGLDTVKFGREEDGVGKLRWVQPVMDAFDGLMAISESYGHGSLIFNGENGLPRGNSGGSEMKKRHWSQSGVDICLFLETEAMERLLVDKELFGGTP